MRSTLVFPLALLAGAAAGGLTALSGERTPRSVLAGLAAARIAVPFFNRLIDSDRPTLQPLAPAGTGAREGESNG
ncbi:hypothetical protein [Streptomyces bluensis]|uniref:Uncharacterized protein n=1 Tax=Streptomyces bluensis TaxID=33897 RepID=A0ABW6UED5_9ACTN|nr:hypothetical protein [Streptomyces bluensis]